MTALPGAGSPVWPTNMLAANKLLPRNAFMKCPFSV
jgi:hypothetical protein